MKKLAYVFLCLTLSIQIGSALKCYQCEGITEENCTKNSSLMRETSCGLEDAYFFRFCLYKVVMDKKTNETNVSYGCDLIGRKAVLKIIPQCTYDKDAFKVKVCHICTTDLCTYDVSTHSTSSTFLILLFCYLLMLAVI